MDERVLDAQRWVNATYSGIAGYDRCPENGKTNWATMYSLTQGLQHELGIQELSHAFGPTTMSKVDARGGVGPGEQNKNIVNIIKCAFYCKGYPGGDLDGIWRSSPPFGPQQDAVAGSLYAMTDNMGIGKQERLNAKLFKALLTMDAYVLVAGGDPEVRKIQQWLNGRYWRRSFATLIPTEGHYSRDVQKLLMKALQSEFGIADASVNGNFGPATQRQLAAHILKPGDSGVLVELLSAACVFNGAVPRGEGMVHTMFKSTFDDKLAKYIQAFQAFSLLPVTNRVDYATWCQLLVSTGDPNRAAHACDTRFTITESLAHSLVRSGYRVVGRYLDEPPGGKLDKKLKDGELHAIFAGNMRVFPIWQYNARDLIDFSFESGWEHGNKAHDRMVYYGFNPGAIVYFSVDHDATDPEIDSNIIPYFRGVQAALASRGHAYRAGVYGCRNVCSRVSEQTYTVSSFVSGMSWGFSGNLGFPLPYNWSFNQIQEVRYSADSGKEIDLDRDVHRTKIDPGIGPDGVGGHTPSKLEDTLAKVDQVHDMAAKFGGGTSDVALINKRVLEFLRHPKYTHVYAGWRILLGAPDEDWLTAATSDLGSLMLTFEDPIYNETVSMDHLAATANAVMLMGWGDGKNANRGDFGGWGGDLSTFYADWMNNERSYASGYAFCMDRLAHRGVESSFGFSDMIEDVDGYLLGRAIRAGVPFKTVLRDYLTGQAITTRFRDFYRLRFNSSSDSVEKSARAMFFDSSDSVLHKLQVAAVEMQIRDKALLPEVLPSEKLSPFFEGFAKIVSQLAESA